MPLLRRKAVHLHPLPSLSAVIQSPNAPSASTSLAADASSGNAAASSSKAAASASSTPSGKGKKPRASSPVAPTTSSTADSAAAAAAAALDWVPLDGATDAEQLDKLSALFAPHSAGGVQTHSIMTKARKREDVRLVDAAQLAAFVQMKDGSQLGAPSAPDTVLDGASTGAKGKGGSKGKGQGKNGISGPAAADAMKPPSSAPYQYSTSAQAPYSGSGTSIPPYTLHPAPSGSFGPAHPNPPTDPTMFGQLVFTTDADGNGGLTYVNGRDLGLGPKGHMQMNQREYADIRAHDKAQAQGQGHGQGQGQGGSRSGAEDWKVWDRECYFVKETGEIFLDYE